MENSGDLVSLRTFGHSAALALHSGNALALHLAITGGDLKDPHVHDLSVMQFRFFTIWNMFFQLANAALGLYCDLATLKKNSDDDQKLKGYLKFKQVLFHAIVWPSTIMTFTIFWPAFIYNRNLLYPEFIDKTISPVSNYIMHGAILPVVLWEIFSQPTEIPKSHKKNLILIHGLTFTYVFWILYSHSVTNMWPYPVLKMIYGTWLFPVLIISSHIILISAYYIQWPLIQLVWEKQKHS